jgi:hypothetical protein
VIRDRPVTSFLLITFGISYAFGIPFNVAVSSLVDSSTLAGLYLPRLVTVIGPAVAALLVARTGHGSSPSLSCSARCAFGLAICDGLHQLQQSGSSARRSRLCSLACRSRNYSLFSPLGHRCSLAMCLSR